MKEKNYPIADPHLNNNKNLLLGLLIGLAILVGGILFYFFLSHSTSAYEKVSATISDIDYIYHDNQVYVDYVYQGVSYTHQALDTYMSGWGVGTVLDIYVNPANPQEITGALSGIPAPFFIIGFGCLVVLLMGLAKISDIVNCNPFVPSREEKNATKARITGVDSHLKNGQFRILFSKNGTAYQSGRCRGDGPLIAELVKNQDIDAPVYLDDKGHFVPDYPGLNKLLMSLKAQAGLMSTPPSNFHGLSGEDDGSGRF
jgi:hypothetical protein